jgi:hypothetical protein
MFMIISLKSQVKDPLVFRYLLPSHLSTALKTLEGTSRLLRVGLLSNEMARSLWAPMRWELGSATPSSFAQGQHMTVRSLTTILEDIPSPIPSDLVIRPRVVNGPPLIRDRLPIFGDRTEAVRPTSWTNVQLLQRMDHSRIDVSKPKLGSNPLYHLEPQLHIKW